MENQPKHCPFNHTNCLGERCALWVELTVHTPGPIPEVQQTHVSGVCVFQAQAQAMAAMVNRPSMVLGAPPIRRRMVGG